MSTRHPRTSRGYERTAVRSMSSPEGSSNLSARLLNKERVKGISCPFSVTAFLQCWVSVKVDGGFGLVKANATANEDAKLRDDEIIPQMR